jgi:hypothetical protein
MDRLAPFRGPTLVAGPCPPRSLRGAAGDDRRMGTTAFARVARSSDGVRRSRERGRAWLHRTRTLDDHQRHARLKANNANALAVPIDG